MPIFFSADLNRAFNGRAALTKGELTVLSIETFFGEDLNGWFYQFLSNQSGRLAMNGPDALYRVGLESYAKILQHFIFLFPNGSASEDDSVRQSQGSGASTVSSVAGAETAAVASSPVHEAVIVVNAAKKGDSGPSCSSDMAANGNSKCGPASSLTELSWEFAEHRDGVDYYKFNWNLTSNTEPKNSKGLTVGFDGDTEITVIDAEHYILIRKGPLNLDSM